VHRQPRLASAVTGTNASAFAISAATCSGRCEGAVPVGFANAREFRQCPFKVSASMRAELRNTDGPDALYLPIRKEVAAIGFGDGNALKEVQSGSDMTRILNPRRNLDALEREAMELLHDLRRMDPKAIQRYSSLDLLEWNSQPGLADTRMVKKLKRVEIA
jgi:hypothetical protein